MKRKVLGIALSITLFCSASLSAVSIGPELGLGGGTLGFGGSLGLSIKLDKTPVVFTIIPSFGYSWFSLGFAADYWFLNQKISDINADASVNWYIGLGGMAAMHYWHYNYYTYRVNYVEGEIGVRIPIGVNFFVQKKFEPYIQLAPTFGMRIYNKKRYWYWDEQYLDKHYSPVGFIWHIPFSLGCRFKL